MNALSATLVLGALWAIWHLPFFFYIIDPKIVIGWLLGLLTGVTILTGEVVDQAALHGILNRIRDLNIPLLSVLQVRS